MVNESLPSGSRGGFERGNEFFADGSPHHELGRLSGVPGESVLETPRDLVSVIRGKLADFIGSLKMLDKPSEGFNFEAFKREKLKEAEELQSVFVEVLKEKWTERQFEDEDFIGILISFNEMKEAIRKAETPSKLRSAVTMLYNFVKAKIDKLSPPTRRG